MCLQLNDSDDSGSAQSPSPAPAPAPEPGAGGQGPSHGHGHGHGQGQVDAQAQAHAHAHLEAERRSGVPVLFYCTFMSELPSCLAPTALYLMQEQRMVAAALCVRAAAQERDSATATLWDAAWKACEEQVADLFEKVVAANDAYVDQGHEDFITDYERECLNGYAWDARRFRKENLWPRWDAECTAELTALLERFRPAAKVPVREVNGEPDYGKVIELLIAREI